MTILALARTPGAQYLVAVVLVLVAVLLTDALPDDVERRNSTLFLGAVMLSGWRGGCGPGVFATGLSALAIAWFFMPPFHNFSGIARSDIARLAIFVVIGVLISYVNYARQRAESRHAALLLSEKLGRARSESMDWRYKGLADALGIVARAREPESALGRIVHLATPRFAAAAAVHVRAADGTVTTRVTTAAIDGSDPEEIFAAARAIESGHAVVAGRLIAVPLVAGGRTLGAISFVAGAARTYREEDLGFAQDLAHAAALVLASPNRH